MPITYKDAGVDIEAGDALVDRIGPHAARTRIPEMLAGVGGFAGLCGLPSGLSDPILVSGTDGVGTKLKVAFETNRHNTIGVDLVAMCVNDVLTTGARPLFFLDYFGTGKLDVGVAEAVVSGIADGCVQAGCALLGGETAELPGMYASGEYDLAGFAVGVVDRKHLLDGKNVRPGDVVIGVASSGLHSNGYSLARRVFADANVGLQDRFPQSDETLAQVLLRPTKIYAACVRAALDVGNSSVRAIAHITGGGIGGNLPRVIPEGLGARIDLQSYERPNVFRTLAKLGPIEEAEMRRTFNLGVGLAIVVEPSSVSVVRERIQRAGDDAWLLGTITEAPGRPFEERVEFVGS